MTEPTGRRPVSTTDRDAAVDPDATQRVARPGTQTGQGTAMRDGAMARTAPRRDLERRARVAGAARPRSAAAAGAAAATATAGTRSRAGAAATPRPTGTRPARRTGPRRVRLTLQRVDPWSVMKISFLVSVALGIAGV